MHFADLTDYSYQQGDDRFTDMTSPDGECLVLPATYRRLNVGWLEDRQPYPTGPVPLDLADKLAAIADIQMVNACLGRHECDLCDEPREYPPLGSWEIRIPGRPGVVYAAPSLIVHYVAVHGYQPPAEFTTAVRAVGVGEWNSLRWILDGYRLVIAFPHVPDGASVLDLADPDTSQNWI
ncbi:hypothetical protein GCM10009678_82830 [Actinomadura kijaniata]|uniref:DUF7919 domain-containing protein n=1 Tax=Actinomadura namibiensis TaxID=182080 RepID=A0A7W3M075_ACTNM|nr:hypothetical protein [Actinomadura namibiensis]MBA8957459.1 hypothetical protein [Actinomadura namibiensis]